MEEKDIVKVESETPLAFADSGLWLDVSNKKFLANLITIETQVKQLKEKQEEMKKLLLYAMEKANITKISSDELGISIAYVPKQENIEKFDKNKFQKENPELYDSYVSFDGKKAAYLTIKIKDKNE